MARYSGSKLAAEIEKQGRRVYWLAEQLGVHPSLIYRMMHGERSMTDENAAAIANVLGVSVETFHDDAVETAAAS